jgi:hypothetical protein
MATKIDPYQPGRSSRFYAGAMNLMQTGAEMQSAAIAGRYQAASAAIGAIGSSVTAALQANTQMKLGMLKLHHDSSIERAKLDVTMAELDMKREAAGLMASESKLRLQKLTQDAEQAELGFAQSQATHEGNVHVAAALPGLTSRLQGMLSAGRPPTPEEEKAFRSDVATLFTGRTTVKRGDQVFEFVATPSGPMADAANKLLEQIDGMTKTQIGDRVYSTAELQAALSGSPYEAAQILRLGAGKPNVKANAVAVLENEKLPDGVRIPLEYFVSVGMPPDIDANTRPEDLPRVLDKLERDARTAKNATAIGVSSTSDILAHIVASGLALPAGVQGGVSADDLRVLLLSAVQPPNGEADEGLAARMGTALAGVNLQDPAAVESALQPFAKDMSIGSPQSFAENLQTAHAQRSREAPDPRTEQALNKLFKLPTGVARASTPDSDLVLFRLAKEGKPLESLVDPQVAFRMGMPRDRADAWANLLGIGPGIAALGRFSNDTDDQVQSLHGILDSMYAQIILEADRNNVERVRQIFRNTTKLLDRVLVDSDYAHQGVSADVLDRNSVTGIGAVYLKATSETPAYTYTVGDAKQLIRREVRNAPRGDSAAATREGEKTIMPAGAPPPGSL